MASRPSIGVLLEQVATRTAAHQALQAGWTAWVDASQLCMSTDAVAKTRPWCRGRRFGEATAWFPRSTKRANKDGHWAVRVGQEVLPALDREGWFLANMYETRPPELRVEGRPCGQLPPHYLDKLHALAGEHVSGASK